MTVFLTADRCRLRTANSSCLSSSLPLDSISPDWCLLLSVVDCPSVSPFANCLVWVPFSNCLLWHFLAHFRSRRRSRAQAFVWFRTKTDKGIVCLADHPRSVSKRPNSKLRIQFRKNSWKLNLHFFFFLWNDFFEYFYCRKLTKLHTKSNYSKKKEKKKKSKKRPKRSKNEEQGM